MELEIRNNSNVFKLELEYVTNFKYPKTGKLVNKVLIEDKEYYVVETFYYYYLVENIKSVCAYKVKNDSIQADCLR